MEYYTVLCTIPVHGIWPSSFNFIGLNKNMLSNKLQIKPLLLSCYKQNFRFAFSFLRFHKNTHVLSSSQGALGWRPLLCSTTRERKSKMSSSRPWGPLGSRQFWLPKLSPAEQSSRSLVVIEPRSLQIQSLTVSRKRLKARDRPHLIEGRIVNASNESVSSRNR